MPKQDPGTEIDSEKYFDAQANWKTFWGQQGKSIPDFAKYLGLTGGPLLHKRLPNRKYTLMLRASAVRKIEKLSSPYHYTFLKAYQVRNGRTKEEREFDDNDRKHC